MRGVILAAGRGSRMRQLTEQAPKCMAVLAGKRLVDWQLEALRGAGITEIVIVRGYRAEQLVLPGVMALDNPRWAESNMVASLVVASGCLESDDCIVSYSDIVYPAATVRRLAAADGDLCITYDVNWLELWRDRFEDPLSDAETLRVTASGEVVEIGERARELQEIQGQYMGLLKFRPPGWARARRLIEGLPAVARDRLDMTGLLKRLIIDGERVVGVPITDPWYEVDSESDLRLYEEKARARGGSLW